MALVGNDLHFDRRNKVSRKYKISALVCGLGAVVLLLLFFVWPQSNAQKQLTAGGTFEQGNRTFEYVSSVNYPNQKSTVLYVYMTKDDVQSSEPDKQIEAAVSLKGTTKSKIKSQVVQVTDDFFVVRIPKLMAGETVWLKMGYHNEVFGQYSSFSSRSLRVTNKTSSNRLNDAEYINQYYRSLVLVQSKKVAKRKSKLAKLESKLNQTEATYRRQKKTTKLLAGSQRDDAKENADTTKSTIDDLNEQIADAKRSLKNAQKIRSDYQAKIR